MTALCNGCQCSPTQIAPARIPNGGRTIALAVSSTNDQRIVAATETGGLFRTFDGGKSWQHLDGLPTYMTRDVAIAATSNNTIIAKTLSRYRAINDGGIWRSTDDGGTWKQPPGWSPSDASAGNDRRRRERSSAGAAKAALTAWITNNPRHTLPAGVSRRGISGRGGRRSRR